MSQIVFGTRKLSPYTGRPLYEILQHANSQTPLGWISVNDFDEWYFTTTEAEQLTSAELIEIAQFIQEMESGSNL